MKKILTGIKPTGKIHLGNYLSTIKNIIEEQNKKNNIFLFIADLHTLADDTLDWKKTHKRTDELVKSYISLGVDPKQVVIYKQSDFPQLTELMWILFSITTFPYIQRSHAYKAAIDSGKEATLALMLYPLLMTSDIILPNFDSVPIGKDQLQHIEYAREWVRKFNTKFGSFFKEPKSFTKETLEIKGTDGRKMSKSYKNTISIFADEKDIKKNIDSIKTDSKKKGEKLDPDKCNVFYFYNLISEDSSELRKKYLSGTIGYREAKDELFSAFMKKFDAPRKKYKKIIKNNKFTEKILSKNRKKINKLLDKRLSEIKILVGLSGE